MLRPMHHGSGVVHLAVFGVVSLCTAIVPRTSQAGGLEFPDLGTVAIGRGTAFVARADDGSAFYYNPAGLSKQPRGNVYLSANFVHLSVDYQRTGSDLCLLRTVDAAGGIQDACFGGFDPAEDWSGTRGIDENGMPFFNPGDTQPYPRVSMDGVGPAPMLVGSWTGIGRASGLSLAIGIVPPSSFGTPKYPEHGPQRYMVQHAEILALFPGIGVAYNVNRYFQIGAVFLSGMTFVHFNQAARLNVQADNRQRGNEDLGGDVGFSLEAKDFFMPTGIIGVLSNPVDWLEIGASVRFPVDIEAKGKVRFTPPISEEAEAELTGDDAVTMRQKFPWLVRVGARYIHDYFDVEADFVYEAWSQLDAFDIDFSGAVIQTDSGPVDLPDTKIPKNFRDTYSLRLGGDVALWPGHLDGRLGYFFQTSSYPKNYETMNLDFPFGEQHGVGGGLTWHAIQYLDVSIGYMHIFQRDIEVVEGIVQQQASPFPVSAAADQDRTILVGKRRVVVPAGETRDFAIGNTVNNGIYEVALNLFGVSLQGRF